METDPSGLPHRASLCALPSSQRQGRTALRLASGPAHPNLCSRKHRRSPRPGKSCGVEVDRYNNHQVHSTTREIPSLRFQRAQEEKKSLFREFMVPPPFKSTKDVFCLMTELPLESGISPLSKRYKMGLRIQRSGVQIPPGALLLNSLKNIELQTFSGFWGLSPCPPCHNLSYPLFSCCILPRKRGPQFAVFGQVTDCSDFGEMVPLSYGMKRPHRRTAS